MIKIKLFLIILLAHPALALDVGKWERHVISIDNPSYSGNPFELEMDGTFTHTSSGTSLTLPGYFDGSDTWKIAFMPTRLGEWIYITTSTDPELDGVSGSLNCTNSGCLGMLKADPDHPRKWKYSDGGYVVPIGVFIQLMHADASESQVQNVATFLKDNSMQMINFRLCEQDVCFSDVAKREMDLVLWNRLERRLEILRDRGIGVDVMMYTDDNGRPSYDARSETEQLLVRYMVARLASFPVVNFNTGIDIWEYRDTSWHDWYGNMVKSLDPYNHPISSRGRSGSELSFMSTDVQTYNSVGDRNSLLSSLMAAFNADDVPSVNNDNWGEDRTGINGHTPADIRRAGWKATIAGGVGFYVRDNKNNDCANGVMSNCDMPFSMAGIQSDLDSEQWLKLVNPFVQMNLGDTYGDMVPDHSLVSNGYALADPARTKILYFLLGNQDTWDRGKGDITVKLSGLNGTYYATWFDTRTGRESIAGTYAGGDNYTISPPSSDDWILLLGTGQ